MLVLVEHQGWSNPALTQEEKVSFAYLKGNTHFSPGLAPLKIFGFSKNICDLVNTDLTVLQSSSRAQSV